MRRLHILLFLLPLVFWGCTEEDEILPDQQKRIVQFLTSGHTPRLVSEQDLEEDARQPFYVLRGNSSYRYIESYYNPDRKNWKEVGPSSKVSITFRAYVFAYTGITDRTIPYFTNDPELEKFFYEEQGLTPGAWSFEPLTLDLAGGRILEGLRIALEGCRENDQVEVYMTYNMAYGEDDFSIVPKESPVAIFFTVNKVE